MCMRYLLLAEGFSDNPLYGKTMRGVLRYRREDVVAILDSTRRDEAVARLHGLLLRAHAEDESRGADPLDGARP